MKLPSGTIYGDTGKIEEGLVNLCMTDINSRDEFMEELLSLADIVNLNNFKKFIYQDEEIILEVTYEELIKEG